MSQELRMVEQNRYDDEIDLYELIEILVRNKKTVIVTFILCFFISLGAALYVRSNREDYLVKNILIEKNDYKINGLNTINPDDIFLRDERIEAFYQIEALNNEYKKEIPQAEQDISSKRKFLQEMIKTSKNEKVLTVKTKFILDEKSTQDILNTYVNMLNEIDNLTQVVRQNKNMRIAQIEELKNQMKVVESKISEIFKNDRILNGLKPEEQIVYIQYKYPELSLERTGLEKYYKGYTDNLVELNSIDENEKRVRAISDTYFVKGETKAKLILAVGAVMGVFLGIMMAFLKEFIDGYKKRYKKAN
ncbi:hypothetical protein H5J22_05775 [Cetobacterium sp. 8H]|uniref:hypothetical protein n=1 Tax=Cetobacterium sp. 8H TaxID=2759681 RepID=UPI00163CE9D5|nr:hypothetical protein [Cetobacterium sp. 8H]MBC2850946.1 hypothetical protein [Cetobacterium sp. 8H]